MTRKLTTLTFTMLFLVAILAITSYASSNSSADLDRARAYAFSRSDLTDGSAAASRSGVATSLGTFTADGGSPGYITGRTFNDQVNYTSPFYLLGWRHSPHIHFTIGAQMVGGDDETVAAKWIDYTMFDPTTAPSGVWQTPVMMHPDPFNYNGKMHQIDVDETGHALISVMVSTPNAGGPSNVENYWDVAGTGAFGTFMGDTLPQSISMDPDATIGYPMVAHQDYGGVHTTHVVAWENIAPYGYITYYRRVGSNPTMGGWETTPISNEVTWEALYALACSQGDGPRGNRVCVAWIRNEGAGPGLDEDDNIAFIESTDGGATWPDPASPNTIINIASEPGEVDWLPWSELHAFYDSEGYLHLSYNAGATVDGSSQGIDPARIYHWTDRVVGDNAGGTLSLVHIADFHGLASMCGRSGASRTNASNPHLSECNGRLYMFWQQFGDPDVGDSLDCPAEPEAYGGYNADLYVSVSLSLDGQLWDAGRNMTNSKTPGCDSTAENNCDHDNWGSVTRYGMNVAAMGDTYWDAVPEAFQVRDYLDADYPVDGWYLDMHYLNDLYPEPAREMDNPVWTYSPMKWFRVPCVDPVIEPNIACAQPDFLLPVDWVKTGTPRVIEDVAIDNIGNDTLNVYSVTADVTTGQQSWISITGVPSTVVAGGAEYFDVTLNPGGVVTTQERLVAEILISSDDPDNPTIVAFDINTVIADTVAPVMWDTIQNSVGFALTVANQGGAGNSGIGQANMDFLYLDGSGPECDATQGTYLYDLSSIIMYDGSGDAGTYSWGPFWTPARAADYNFLPVAGDIEALKCGGDGFLQYRTGTFITSDSALGCTKHWVAPDSDESWVIEKWEIYSYDGGTVTGVRFGEWIDWDIPSGTNGNEGGFVSSAGSVDYVYQQGVVDPEGTPCLNEDLRYGGSGLLGYYTSSEKEADAGVNHTGLYGGFVHLDDDLFASGTDQFIVDSVWAWLNRNTLTANNSADDDQQVMLSYGSFDVIPDDTVVIWTVHASVYDGDGDTLQSLIDAAEAWYLANRDKVGTCFDGCCGIYTDGDKWPLGYSGNANCSDDGKRTLSDISRMIDFLYISKQPLCCYAAGNANGSLDYNDQTGEYDCKITLSDISKMIDALYISKQIAAECQSVCER